MMPASATVADLRLRNIRLSRPGQAEPRVDIDISAGRIQSIKPASAAANTAVDGVIIDGADLIAAPGFVNAHTHSNEAFEQGCYEGQALEIWLAMAYPPLAREMLPPRLHYLRAMMVALQSLRSGVTALHDDFLNPQCSEEALENVIDAYRDAGVRATVAVTFGDRSYLDALPDARQFCPPGLAAQLDALPPGEFASQKHFFENALQQLTRRDQSRLGLSLGPRGPQRCTPGLLRGVAELAARHAVPVHMHLLESRAQALAARRQYGKTFVEVLNDVGLLGPSITLNHAIWLTQADIALIAARGAKVVHNPLSNFKLSSGLCPLKKLLAAGITVGLGSDGAATGDTVDFLETIRMAALAHRLDVEQASDAPCAHRIVGMATENGAATMGGRGRFGQIEIGQEADLTLLDADHFAFVPLNNAERQLCYSATSSAIHTVIVAGRVVFANGKSTLLDEAALRAEIREHAERFRRDVLTARAAANQDVLPFLRQVLNNARLHTDALNTVNRVRLP
jgi:5-methylthioadenosine/S-adenosylhomocysteine deaminase